MARGRTTSGMDGAASATRAARCTRATGPATGATGGLGLLSCTTATPNPHSPPQQTRRWAHGMAVAGLGVRGRMGGRQASRGGRPLLVLAAACCGCPPACGRGRGARLHPPPPAEPLQRPCDSSCGGGFPSCAGHTLTWGVASGALQRGVRCGGAPRLQDVLVPQRREVGSSKEGGAWSVRGAAV